MKKTRTFECGATLLEYALALPVVLTLTLGAIDISRVLQVQAALNQGTKEALRCLYPTDGGCSASTYTPGTALYNWYGSTASVGYDMGTFDYNGTASWFSVPRYTYNNIHARVLSSYQFDVPQQNYQAKRVSFARSQEFRSYVRLTTLPFITGASALNPEFRYKNITNGTRPLYPGVINVSLGSIDLATAPGGTRQASVTFVIPAPVSNVDLTQKCNPSTDIDKQGASTTIMNADTELSSCTASHLRLTGAVLLHPKGTVSGAGKTTLTLSHAGGTIDLGGRVWTGTGNGNFVPRGIPDENLYVAEHLRGTYEELRRYPNLALPFNQPITLTFAISKHPNYPHLNGEWHGTGLAIYRSRFSERVETASCPAILRGDYEAATSGGGQPPGCEQAQSFPISLMSGRTVTVNTSANVDPTPPIPLGCNLSGAAAISTLGAGNARNFDVLTTQAACTPYVAEGQCSENNGVPEDPDSAGFIRNSPLAQSLCPPEINAQMQSALVQTMTNLRWRESPRQVMSPNNPTEPFSFEFLKASCNAVMTPPSALSAYPPNKLQIGSPSVTTEPSYTGSIDPRYLKIHSPAEYDCPELQVVDSPLSESTAPTLPTESLFMGVRNDLGEDCWEDMLRADARERGIPEGAFLRLEREGRGFTTFASPPTTSCAQTLTMRFDSRSESLLTTTPLPEGQMPTQCQSGSLSCRAVLERFIGGTTSEVTVDENAAKARALDAIQTAYPQSAPCNELSEPNCVTLSLARLNTPGANEEFRMQASAKVPLALLLGAPIELSALNMRASEGNFFR